jgi:hypothetical protein
MSSRPLDLLNFAVAPLDCGRSPQHLPPSSQPTEERTKRRAPRFTQSDLYRAIRAAQEAKLKIAEIRIERDGAILIVPGTPKAVPHSQEDNEWDE